MKLCENCNNEHDGTYGSGRFCSSKCARGFSTKEKRSLINEKVSKKLKGNIPWHKNKTNVYSIECTEKRSNSIKQYFNKNKGEASRRLIGHIVTEETKIKISNSVKGKTGGIRKGGGRGKHGWYKGYWCDSSWELAWVIYNLDHNIKFERNKQGFEYVFEGKTYKYYPDFKINNEYIEIKGWMDKKNDEKIKQFKGSLKVLFKNDLQLIFKFVETKYGKNYINLYKQ